jgi:hypothetical protein
MLYYPIFTPGIFERYIQSNLISECQGTKKEDFARVTESSGVRKMW